MSAHETTSRRPGRARRAIGWSASLALLAAGVAACSHDAKNSAADEPPGQQSVPVRVVVTRVAGNLGDAAKADVASGAKKPIEAYVEAAFLGDNARSDFTDAFGSFTKGAAQQADKDVDLVTGAGFASASGVTAKALDAYLAVLAPKGKPAGATARIHFELDDDGHPVTYTGRLLLTVDHGAWRIFGYDLARSDETSTVRGSSNDEGNG